MHYWEIPKFDRRRADPADLIVVVTAIADGTVTMGIKHGALDRQLEQNALEVTKMRSVTIAKVPDVHLLTS